MEKIYRAGIDIGSTCAKTVVIDSEGQILHRSLRPTGWSSIDTARDICQSLAQIGFDCENTRYAATGYGRINVPYAEKCVTEITCHARGACAVYDADDITVIDIGGQDTKIIRVQERGVADFLMNDKCSAGTGRFLEIMANTLSLRPEELCALAEQGRDVFISSMCTVFAESEVVSLIGKGEKRENIAFAVVDSIVSKVLSQVTRLQANSDRLCLTGGLCDFPFLKKYLEQKIGRPVMALPDGRYAGAVGAARSLR